MNYIIEEIFKILTQVHERVYQIEADEDAEYPFLTFAIKTGYEEERKFIDTLAVEVWDEKEETTDIEDLADKIKKILDHKIIDTEKINTVVYIDTRKNPTETKDEVNCRELRFELHTYFK
ncbi:hypothetical protein [Clostridium sp. 1001270J_160509_D11]|uniref:hypothetical protein n=1 Tax=Clostridium sp. 1001270J_160509_D11 TaxID=2787103 RepID=UPI0018A9D0B7|nr:hypothetical protein [Clostridium sp. 1001270J_160509_D11]